MTERNEILQTPLQTKVFHPADAVFALLSALFAFFFLKYTFASAPGIALTAITVLFEGATLIYARLRKRPLNGAVLFWAAVIFAFSLVFTLTANSFLKGWTVFFLILATAYWIFLTFGNRTEKYADDMLGFDLLKSLILLPFGNVHQFFRALGESGKKHKAARTALYILLGLGVALIPSIIVFSLLTAGDTVFANLTEYLFKDLGEALGQNFACLFFALPIGTLIFGLWYGAAEQKYTTLLSRRSKDGITRVLRFSPSAVACAALTPMLLIYVLFFVSQAGYHLDAFRDLRPEGYTYAEYAREGFFQLVAVCAVNAAMILAVHFFTKRKENGRYSLIAKIYVVLFALSSIFLAVIALRKMLLYIDQYGLTLSRVYASWFMILLSVFFLILILKQFLPKFNGILAGLLAFVLLFGGLCLCNADARVAEYNLERYLAETDRDPDDLDLDMFRFELSDAAVIAVDEVYDRMTKEEQAKADDYFLRCARNILPQELSDGDYDIDPVFDSFRSWNIDSGRAEEILRRRCPDLFEGVPHRFGWTW